MPKNIPATPADNVPGELSLTEHRKRRTAGEGAPWRGSFVINIVPPVPLSLRNTLSPEVTFKRKVAR